MAVEDFGRWDNGRWLIEKRDSGWVVWPSLNCIDGGHKGFFPFPTFAEAHAAYLDAVTCPEAPPLWGWDRCQRARGHRGQHRHPYLNTQSGPLLFVNPK